MARGAVMSPRWSWPADAIHRLEIRATPEQWAAWNTAARLSGVAVEVWLTQAVDAHARNLQRAVKRAEAAGRKGQKGPAPEHGGEGP